MKQLFNIAIVLQFIFTILFIDHRFFKPLGSELMYWVLMASTCISIFMIWQIITSKELVKSHKVVGGILASLPLIWYLSFLIFMH
jgi:hypothetical protein